MQTASVWIFMLITVERFLAVCLPLRVAHYCTVERSRLALVLVYLAAFAYNIVRFWEYTTVRALPSSLSSHILPSPGGQ